MAKANIDKLNDLHGLLAEKMSEMLTGDRELTAAELSTIITFLKNNDISADIVESAPMQNLIANAMQHLNKRSA